MGSALKIVAWLFALVALFGIITHPNFLSSSTTSVTSVIGQVQKG